MLIPASDPTCEPLFLVRPVAGAAIGLIGLAGSGRATLARAILGAGPRIKLEFRRSGSLPLPLLPSGTLMVLTADCRLSTHVPGLLGYLICFYLIPVSFLRPFVLWFFL